MKRKLSHSHPDGCLNYLVSTSIVKREMFFLQCELNDVYGLILSNSDLTEKLASLEHNKYDYMMILNGVSRADFGVRGFLYEFVIDCKWDIEEFVYMHRDRLNLNKEK